MLMTGSGRVIKKIFNTTSVGFDHIRRDIVCQDYSASYLDEERAIITVCDGHGGSIYLRSNRGSKFGCEALIEVFKTIDKDITIELFTPEFISQLKLKIICYWNDLVNKEFNINEDFEDIDDDFIEENLTPEEINKLSESQLERIKHHKATLYGTTMLGCVVINDLLISVQLGDGLLVYIDNEGLMHVPFIDIDDNVANYTCSLCQEDAFEHIHVDITKLENIKSVFVCTDGVVNSYQAYDKYLNNFALPITKILVNEENGEELVRNFIETLGTEKGIGDDVSLGVMIIENETTKSTI